MLQLGPLLPPGDHFKIRRLALADVLWDLLAYARLRLRGFDVGAGFQWGEGRSWRQLRL